MLGTIYEHIRAGCVPMLIGTYTDLTFLFERSEFLIATCKKKKTDRLSVWMFG